MYVNFSGVLDIINGNEVGNNKKQSVRLCRAMFFSVLEKWSFSLIILENTVKKKTHA